MKSFKHLVKIFTEVFLGYLFFWGWNLLFIVLLIYSSIETGWIHEIIYDGIVGRTPWDMVFFTLLLISIPFVAVVLGFMRFRTNPQKLIRLFYGVEMPLVILIIIRFAAFRELTIGTKQLAFLFAIAIITFFVDLLKDFKADTKTKGVLQILGYSIVALVGAYCCVLLLYYVVPMFGFLGQAVAHFKWRYIGEFFRELEFHSSLFWAILFVLFAGLCWVVFLSMPIAVFIYYLRGFLNTFRQFAANYGKGLAWGLLLALVISNVAFFRIVNWNQPQHLAFELLEKPAQNDEERANLLKHKDDIRKGLVNAYLASYRYMSSEARDNHIQALYKEAFGMDMEASKPLQDFYCVLTKPLLYEGTIWTDEDSAAVLYEQFFDTPIQKGEKEAVMDALSANWDRDGVEAGLLNLNAEKVLITKQQVDITEHGDWAEVELYECYQNQTFFQQEIFYYFYLPENAAITGLWLSDEDTVKKKYEYVVATRGAAQKVYKAEVQRRVDPSLLEQVGPRQYRLRAFPIEAKRYNYSDNKRKLEEGNNFHLWLSYKVMIDEEGNWPMPELAEKRNVYWSGKTKFSLNGEEQKRDKEIWYPQHVKAKVAAKAREHFAVINDSLSMVAKPYQVNNTKANLKGNFALVVDRSYSMNEHKEEFAETVNRLNDFAKTGAAFDVFLGGYTAEETTFGQLNAGIANKQDGLLCMGSIQHLDLLKQFDTLRNGQTYDAVFMLTDQGSYELAQDKQEPLHFEMPVYLVHLGGEMPRAYDDALFKTIQECHGDGVNSIDAAVADFTTNRLYLKAPEFVAYSNGYLYLQSQDSTAANEEGFAGIAAKQFIKSAAKDTTGGELARLDELNAAAKRFSIVTPYSSMIVLVNDRQKEDLAKAEKEKDRFDREVESGKENLTKPHSDLNVSGAPEPEEWLLFGLTAIFLLWVVVRKRRVVV